MDVRFTRLDPQVPLPEYKTPGAVGFDIAVREGGVLAPGERRLFKTGLIVCVPEGYGLFLYPRSSNAKKGVTFANAVGVLDQDFCGPTDEIRLALHNVGNEPYTVEAYERIGQGVFLPILKPTLVEGDATGPSRGGFGTTG